MKQAIDEGFILDVLRKLYAGQQLLPPDQNCGRRSGVRHPQGAEKLRRYVESHNYAIDQKAHIIVEHFHESVLGQGKIGGQAGRWS